MVRLSLHSQIKGRHVTPGAIVMASIAIAVSLWLLVFPPAELKAQANSAPTIYSYSTPNSVTTGNRVTFQSTATDSDGNITKWGWYLDDVLQGEYTFNPQRRDTRVISHTFSTAGDYTLKSTFTDSGGLSVSHTWDVEVTEPPPLPPSVSVTVASNPSGRTVTVDGTDHTAPYTATWDSGSSHSLNVPSPQNVSGVSSRYVFSSWGHGGAQSQSVAPTSNTTYPANFTQQHFLSTGSSIAGGGQWYDHNSEAFVGPAPDREGYVFSHWEKGGQNIGTDQAGVTVTVDAPFRVDAVYAVSATNRAPSITDSSPASRVSLPKGSNQTFSVTATDPDGNISSWEWFLDDVSQGGQSLALTGDITRTFSYTFATLGEYTVRATFTDDDGLSGSVSWTVVAEVPLIVQLGADNYTVSEDDGEVEITVTISASPPEYVSLRFQSRDGTAQSHRDFSGISTLVSFPRDTTTLTQTVPVTILDDGTVEATEAFTVGLETTSIGLPTYVSLTRSEATVKVLDDDAANVAFTENRFSVSEDLLRLDIAVDVETDPPSLTCPVAFPFDVNFSYTDPDGALSSTSTIPSSVAFDKCQSRVAFEIGEGDLTGIGVVTGTTEVVFTLDRATSGTDGTVLSQVTVGEPSTLTLTIQDEDEAAVRWKRFYDFAFERSQYDSLCVIIEDQKRIGRPFTVHFSYTDPAGALSSPSTIPSSVTFGTGESEKCVDEFDLGDVGSDPGYASVMFTLDRVTSAGSDVASRVIINVDRSTLTVEVIDSDGPLPPVSCVGKVSITNLTATPSRVRAGEEVEIYVEATASGDEDLTVQLRAEVRTPSGGYAPAGSLRADNIRVQGGASASTTFTWDPRVDAPQGTYQVDASVRNQANQDQVCFGRESLDSFEVLPPDSRPNVTRVSPPQESLSLYTGETQEFRVRATDADYNLTKWEWEADWHGFALPGLDPGHIEPGESFSVTGGASEDFSFTFPRDGTWTVTVTFTDVGGQSGSAAWTVDVTDGPDLAIDELELMSLKPFQEVGKIIPPATVGDSFGVELDYRHRFGPASGPFEINFYFKNPIWDFDRGILTSFEVEPAFDPDADILLTPSLSGPSLTFGGEGKTVIHDVDVPSSIKAGPYWFCAQIENKEQIPDPREDDNARCTLMYVVSHAKVAEWVHPVAPFDGSDGRVWYGSFYKYFDPNEFAKNLASGRPPHPDFPFFLRKDGRRISLYRHVALELAKRQAIETEGYLPYVAGVRDKIERFSASTATMDSVLTIYGEAHNVTGVLGGSSSHAVGSLLNANAAGPVLSAVNLASDGVDLHLAIIVNRAVNLDRALDTLKVLEDLPIDEDFPVAENEWHAGIRLAEQDLKDMTSGEAWREYSVAVGEEIDELAVSSLGFTVSVVAASGLTIKGIALGTAAHAIAPFLLIIPVVLEVDGAIENMRLSMVAAQVYAELYQEDASGDHLETIKYAKFAAYDYLDEGYDNWIEKLLNVLFIRDTGSLRTRISESRDAALEEARAAIQLASIEFNPPHYSLKVGDVVRLEPEFKSGSGKNMIGYGVEWDVTSYDPPDTEVVAIDDTGVVTALRSGEAIIAANIGSVVGGGVVTVTSDYECVNGAVADTTNTGLVADCEALLAARDTLGGEPTLTWSEDTPITEWDGVTLGGTPSRVTGLDLQGEDLDGTIPAVLKALAKLERLDLRSNMLTGPIPDELESLVNLRELRLSGNQLIGCVPAGLRDVAVHDLGDLVIPYCDELLSSLAIDPATSLEPPFDPYHTSYTAVAEESQVTVTPTNDHGATFEFLDGDYGALADADGSEAGHQVDLTVGVTPVRVRVGGLTYTVMVAYGDLLTRYDGDGDGTIEKSEVIKAINDYLFDEGDPITRAEVIKLINLYLFG